MNIERCVLCSEPQDRFKPYCERSGYKIVRCGACGLIFVNPRDEEGRIEGQYLENLTSPAAYYAATAEEDRENGEKVLKVIEKYSRKGTLLDVGCNVGTFLETARDSGWNASGLDANPETVSHCRQKGLNVFQGFFGKDKSASGLSGEFDVLAMNDTIEHFPNPREAVRASKAFIKTRGYISVLTPNIESPLARMFQIKPKEHLFYFSMSTLTQMLEAEGFRVVHMQEWPRKRNVGAMHLGATFENPMWKWVSKFLSLTKLDIIVNAMLEILFKEQILAVAQKS